MNLSAIEVRRLRYFVAVVEHGSFRAAALRLGVSQPPLTRQIQQLEAAVETPLLIRRARGVELTEAGRQFHADTLNILNLIERAGNRAKQTGSGRLGRIDVGVFGSAIFGAIPRIVSAYRERFPNVEIELYTMGRADQLKALREQRIAVGFNRYFEDEPDLEWETVHAERMNVAVHEAHPLSARKVLSLAEIAGERLILYPRAPRPGFVEYVIELFHQRRQSPCDIREVDDVGTAVALVSCGLGLSLVTDSARNLRLPGVAYVPLIGEDQAVADLCMSYRKRDESELLRQFLEIARSMRSNLSSPRSAADASDRQGAGQHP